MTTTIEEVLDLFKQFALAQQETERLLREQSLESDRHIEQVPQQLRRFFQNIGKNKFMEPLPP